MGAIALWGGSGTDGYFANLKISYNKERRRASRAESPVMYRPP
jgi:hypothetical protein